MSYCQYKLEEEAQLYKNTDYTLQTRPVKRIIHYISAVVTQHIKSVALLQLITFGFMFRPLPGHHQANKEQCC